MVKKENESSSLSDILNFHDAKETAPPNTNIHENILDAFNKFGTMHEGEKNISFNTILRYWTLPENIHFTDTKYDHDLYLYYIASKFNDFCLWEEMVELITLGSFFHQVRQSGGVHNLLNSSRGGVTEAPNYGIFIEASRLPHEKEPIQIFLSKYLPLFCDDTKVDQSTSTTCNSRVIARYKENMSGIVLNDNDYEKKTMKSIVKKLAKDTHVSLKLVQTLLNNKTILLSEIGYMTPNDLKIKDGDVIDFVDRKKKSNSFPKNVFSPSLTKGNNKMGMSKRITSTNQKKKKQKYTNYVCHPKNQEKVDDTLKYRLEHSRNLSKVFEEARNKFKSIRTNLNSLSLRKTQPKTIVVRRKNRTYSEETPEELLATTLEGGKPGRVAYIVRIGESTHLYKSRKLTRFNRTTSRDYSTWHEIDLHRLTKHEAEMKLEEKLPIWVRDAMEGSFPWVVTVRIVCGGGNQTLSDTVRDWIRQNDCVANAF